MLSDNCKKRTGTQKGVIFFRRASRAEKSPDCTLIFGRFSQFHIFHSEIFENFLTKSENFQKNRKIKRKLYSIQILERKSSVLERKKTLSIP